MSRTSIRKIITALTLSLALTASACSEALAAAASAEVDETLYLNLDYYGSISNANVVKGISFNSRESYTDFGSYTSVINMSTSDEIVHEVDAVTIKAPENGSKLFFQGTMEPGEVSIPWSFDITYKLNGVVTDASGLGGAGGLVEIDIDAYPVTAVSEYMRNNFVLMAAIPVDGGNYYSVDAPGAQIANLGEYSCVIFEALPGKEGHFEARFGTDCFETVGVVMMMSPMTVDDLENIKDLDELETKFRDNTNAMMDDVEALMDNVTGMTDELALTNQMLSDLKKGKDKVHASGGILLDGADVAIQDIRDLSDTLTPLDTSLRSMQWMVYDVYESLNDMDQDMLITSTRIKTLNSKLKDLGSALNGVNGISSSEIESEWEEILEEINSVQESYDELKETGEFRRSVASSTDYVEKKIAEDDDLKELLHGGTFMDDLSTLSYSLSWLAYAVAESMDEDAEELSEVIVDVSEDIEEICSYTGAVTFQTARVMESMRTLIGDMDELVAVMNNYYGDIQELLTATDNILLELKKTSDDLAYILQVANDTLRSSRDDFSNAADAGIEAGQSTIESTYEMIDNISDLKESGRDLRQSINDKLDETEEENNFLKMDPYAVKVSLTSTRNPEPRSVAIILRSEEISADDDEVQAILDAEEAEAKSTVWERIRNVFIKIYEAIRSIF